MLRPSFQVQLNETLFPKLVCYGRFGGTGLSLAAATTGGRVLLHSPHAIDTDPEAATFLRIRGTVQALAAGRFSAADARDLLFIGTSQSVQAYDVAENADAFNRAMPNGVDALHLGPCGRAGAALLLVASGLAVTGLDAQGRDALWCVSSDRVAALALSDIDGDGRVELLAGCESSDIHVFREEALQQQIGEADAVTALCALGGGRFAYTLANRTLGVYAGVHRAWRVKSKQAANCLCAAELRGDGETQLLSGWVNGKLEVRAAATGEVLFRDQLPKAVAHIAVADLRSDSTRQILVCLVTGELRGYVALEAVAMSAPARSAHDMHVLQQVLADLQQRKRELSQESHLLGQSLRAEGAAAAAIHDVVPPDTAIAHALSADPAAMALELVLETNNACVIKGVVLFAEQLFDGESLFVPAARPARRLAVRLSPQTDKPVDMLLKVLVGAASSEVYHVFEAKAAVPRNAMFVQVPVGEAPHPSGHATFSLPASPAAVQQWAAATYGHAGALDAQGALAAAWACVRDGSHLIVTAEPEGAGSRVTVLAATCAAAAAVVASLAAALQLRELVAAADFPEDFDAAAAALAAVAADQSAAETMHAEAADATATLKALVVKAEDGRLQSNMGAMRRQYRALRDLNRDLVARHERRCAKHSDVAEGLRGVGRAMHAAAQLRLGGARAAAVAACRAAVQAGDAAALLRGMRNGA